MRRRQLTAEGLQASSTKQRYHYSCTNKQL